MMGFLLVAFKFLSDQLCNYRLLKVQTGFSRTDLEAAEAEALHLLKWAAWICPCAYVAEKERHFRALFPPSCPVGCESCCRMQYFAATPQRRQSEGRTPWLLSLPATHPLVARLNEEARRGTIRRGG